MRINEFTAVIGVEVKIYLGVERLIKTAAESHQIAIAQRIFLIFSGSQPTGKYSKNQNSDYMPTYLRLLPLQPIVFKMGCELSSVQPKRYWSACPRINSICLLMP